MDREILYRGKRVDGNGWAEGGIVPRANGQIFIAPIVDASQIIISAVDPDTVGQYTGLKDRNGKRIFEGDVVEYYISYSGEVNRSVVVWGDGGWATQDSDFDEPVLIGEIGALGMTVVGNIHDNPELLEV